MDAKARAAEHFAAAEQDLRSLRRWMFDHPETAFEERETSRHLAEFLTARGFVVEHPAYGLETAFAARAGTTGPEAIVCAELDALPGVGHACGHNLISTAAVGAGLALAPLAEELGFRVTVLGTPAEEALGGKQDLIDAGAFSDAALAMMVHPDTEDTVDPFVLAVNHLVVEFHGKTAHASASPWEGHNALDAFVLAYVNVAALRQAMYPTDKTHCMITHGGEAPNIIPHYTRSEWYVRSGTKARLEVFREKVLACFRAAAEATGCTVDVNHHGHEYQDLISDPVLTDLFLANARSLGRGLARGADRDPATAGSTDMGNVSHVVPALHPFMDIGCAPVVNHQPEFAAATLTAEGDRMLRDGALGMAWTIIDVAQGNRWGELGAPLR